MKQRKEIYQLPVMEISINKWREDSTIEASYSDRENMFHRVRTKSSFSVC